MIKDTTVDKIAALLLKRMNPPPDHPIRDYMVGCTQLAQLIAKVEWYYENENDTINHICLALQDYRHEQIYTGGSGVIYPHFFKGSG